jgi:hypothetical protein
MIKDFNTQSAVVLERACDVSCEIARPARRKNLYKARFRLIIVDAEFAGTRDRSSMPIERPVTLALTSGRRY